MYEKTTDPVASPPPLTGSWWNPDEDELDSAAVGGVRTNGSFSTPLCGRLESSMSVYQLSFLPAHLRDLVSTPLRR